MQHASAEVTQQNILEWLSIMACGNAEKQTEPGSLKLLLKILFKLSPTWHYRVKQSTQQNACTVLVKKVLPYDTCNYI